ncbi:A/G-specific adenine glycosylase [Ramlibacter rhizophilus]|uniref:Adenine DNA glycosylase n=1 Tax=Ramlibacter rhizophilus TaxID=1781167 RepID=A0A4Z0BPB0_9BURK|nr:A/G-specific adenine glycosylase [Ramlibacter rhizophilus]TFZ01147.1 A/G-specific adenine glycosylase [Ramlibacter rhizophilus]
MSSLPQAFAGRVVAWQKAHGRSGLPWQATRDPYRVWLSEIMLQQTQVSTVLGYYQRFLARFPDVRALAAAPLDEVFGLWSGLGYYSRARNLHACAQQVVTEHGGMFPDSAAALATLPGIGRSTAAAIAAFCFGERVAILDGNVKRVLTRVLGFDADLAQAASERRLWDRANELLPAGGPDMPAYTQGLMDLGATVCLARRPQCDRCPVQAPCVAFRQGEPERYPVKTRKLRRTAQSLWLLRACRTGDGAVWLQRRPDSGVWAGLYCLPVFDSFEALRGCVPAGTALEEEPGFLHVLTHKDLHLHPVRVQLGATGPATAGEWAAAPRWEQLGLPAPIRRLLTA